MGGKHKQAQRTKNNARPSSSGRSAELLGASIPTFVGFSAAKDGGFIPVIPGFGVTGLDDIDPNIDTNFQLVLKKMNKKDATTKHKALQEFSDLVTNSDIEILKTVLPFWPRLYCSLAVDTDHRVREASHIAQRSVAIKAKRNLAPYLKQLIGPWFTSQYDSYPPAASAAQLAFEDAFPPKKISEVIAFCQEEILSYIYDNLIENNFQSSSNTKHLNAEEIEARNQRILIASLQGYSLYLKKLSTTQIESGALESNRKIVSNSKFWKYSKHKVPLIRAAWFSTLGTLLQHAPTSLLENEGQRVTTTVLANLDETDPTVVPVVWETALLALFTVQDWWTHINVEKLVLPKLWRVLRDAAQGNATSIYPNLLPLISKFPPGSDAHAFYTTFFDNVRLGLKQKSVQQSRSELNSVVTSFMECLQYVILRNQSDYSLCESLMKRQLLETIEWSLFDGHFATKVLFSQTTNLIHYWSRNRDNHDMPQYSQLLHAFWSALFDICKKVFSKTCENFDSTSRDNVHTKMVELLCTLKRNHSIKTKKQLKVQFTESKKIEESVVDSGAATSGATTNTENTTEKNDEKFLNELNTVAYQICNLYIEHIFDFINLYINHLSTLIQEFDSIDLFNYLRTKLNFNRMYDIYGKVFCIWLESTMVDAREITIDLTFILMKYLNVDEIDVILNSFCSLNNQKILLRCMSQSLAHPYRNMTSIRMWLKRDEIANLLESCAQSIIDVDENETGNLENLALLRLACAPDDNGELLINSDALMKIVQVFCKPLLNPCAYPKTLDLCARFAAVLSAFLYSDDNVHNYNNNIELLVALFSLNVNNEIETATECILSEDTLWEINTAWQDAIIVLRTIYSLECTEFVQIVNKFSLALKNTFNHQINDEKIDKNVRLTIEFLKSACRENVSVGRVAFVLSIILKHFDTSSIVRTLAENLLNADIIDGTYVSVGHMERPTIDEIYVEKFNEQTLDQTIDQEQTIDLNQMRAFCEFTIRLIAKLYDQSMATSSTEQSDENVNNDDNENENTFILDALVPEIENQIIYQIFTFILLQKYCEYFKITSQFEIINQNFTQYKNSITNLLTALNSEMIEIINSTIFNRALNVGFLWSRTYYIFITQLKPKHLKIDDLNTIFLNGYHRQCAVTSDNKFSQGLLHWIQTFARDLHVENIIDYLPGKSQVECLVVIRSLPMTQSTDVLTMEALSIIKTIHKRSDILLDKDISTQPWDSIEIVVEVIRFMATVVKYRPHLLSSTYWDFIFIGLYGWIETVRKSLKADSNLLVLAIGTSVCDLFVNVCVYMENIKNDIAAGDSYQKLVEEWDDIVSVEISSGIFRFYICTIEKMNEKNYENFLIVVKHLATIVPHLNTSKIARADVQIDWHDLTNRLINHLNSNLPAQQLAAAILLQDVVSIRLIEEDTSAVTGESQQNQQKQLTIELFKIELEKSQLIVESMVQDLRLGEQSCQVKSFTEAYQYTSCYLLTWSILLTMITKASTNLRYQYTEWIKDNDYLKILIHNIVRLMPERILDPVSQPTPQLSNLFEKLPTLNIDGDFAQTSEWIESCACAIFSAALAVMPALVRQWWSNCESRVARIVERITSTFVSAQLCARELQNVSINSKQMSEHMHVRVHPTAREVIATYSVDEARMEILISLPSNYPLGSVKIDCNKQIGGTNQWRNSIMQLSLFLTHQNGNVMDGLALWKSNLDKHFDGVEECYICFSVIHPGTMQLPKLSCQKCRKKFHSACLYKWFSTSNKSTCPICRSLF